VQHQIEIHKELERAFSVWARVKLAGGGAPTMEQPIGQAARGMEVYNGLENDEDYAWSQKDIMVDVIGAGELFHYCCALSHRIIESNESFFIIE
jgi:hypothetical protein